MMRLILIFFLFSISVVVFGQNQNDKPKLVVAIVIDQMRNEFLDRFQDKFGEDGFKKIMNEGFNYRNHHYNYMPTTTGPGHAAIFTGALPSVSGIVYNAWYDKDLGKAVNCVNGNDNYTSIGIADSLIAGHAAPDYLLCTTVGDELKKASQFKSKSYAVSIKDRSSILAVGHRGDGAFWFDAGSGRFISSSYYMDKLPQWVEDFNSNGYVDSLNQKIWNLSFPEEEYVTSRPDDNRFEAKFNNQDAPTFPYDLKELNKGTNGYFYLPYTPFGNEMVAELGKVAIKKEQLGKGNFIDFLAVNFSSTDYTGHKNGPYSIEIEDMYIKLDKTIADFIQFLNIEVGSDEYVLFITADHGAVAAPLWLREQKLPGGLFNPSALANRVSQFIDSSFGIDSAILHRDNFQIYLDNTRFTGSDQKWMVADAVKDFLIKEEFVQEAYTKKDLQNYPLSNSSPKGLLRNSFYPHRSGDIFYISRPGWLGSTSRNATGHGTPFAYDTHVPLLWYGKNIPKGNSVRRVHITDIAPTLSAMCRVMFPSGTFGNPLIELFD
jgi:predicted AlkP superfamily pyrophosphatase or phosphodiesterase